MDQFDPFHLEHAASSATDPRFKDQCPNNQAHQKTCTRFQRGTGGPPANPLTSKLEREVECKDRLEIESLTFFLFSTSSYILCPFAEAQKVPAIYVLGDSLVDVGNNNHLKLSLAKADFAHSASTFLAKNLPEDSAMAKTLLTFLGWTRVGCGHETSNLPSVRQISGLEKINPHPSANPADADWQFGGWMRIGLARQSIPLTKQVEYYSTVYEDLVQQLGSATALDHLSKSLFAVVIGSNDILGYFKSGSDLPKKITQQQYVDLMVMTLKDVLKPKFHACPLPSTAPTEVIMSSGISTIPLKQQLTSLSTPFLEVRNSLQCL
ncbi:hypothetical protein TEA_006042 [Camellia sinensis var. sinensis]|uniref:GDSL esterase/lipase n=1 Tax=Camellia sinensis var. sinensis TaxID=542762 RepID=A0A4V3WLW3_CAMSN|nr:hypothetical protein TEA_006042 [Camellia sinensis var. sinensis]